MTGRVQATLPSGPAPSNSGPTGGVVGAQGPLEKSGIAGGSVGHARQRGVRTSQGPHPGVLQQTLPGVESDRGLETGHRPIGPQQVRVQDRFQDGHPEVGNGSLEGGGLHDVPGPQGRQFSDPCPPLQNEVSKGEVGYPSLAVQDSLLRAVDSPSGLHESLHNNLGLGAQTGHLPDSLPGRLVVTFSLRGSTEGARREASTVLQGLGYHHQPGKVAADALHQDNLPGDGSRHPVGEGLPLLREVGQSRSDSSPLPSGLAEESQRQAEVGGPPRVGEVSPPGESQAESGSMEPKGALVPGGVPAQNSPGVLGDKGDPEVVA
ncbi:collagen alpha-2(IX) chain-like [Palaemon carinicauda]|uniref:collagen alpha-2(IX) chain-like n=1 Tax=Palaemon carinicauda TaxID=392227 RepID=UPI0035B5BEB1